MSNLYPLPSLERETDTVDALNERIASLKMRILLVDNRLGGHKSELLADNDNRQEPTLDESGQTLPVVDRVLKELNHGGGPLMKQIGGDAPAPKKSGVRNRLQRFKGPDPTEALGVAMSDDLDSWMTDENAVVTPSAYRADDPITAEMDAITKPSVYDALAPDENERLWRSVAPQSVAPTGSDDLSEPRDTNDTQRRMTMLVIAIVVIGLVLVASLWFSTGDEAAAFYGTTG